MRKTLFSCLLLLIFAVFLLFKNAVIAGACEGLLLWYSYVLPSLLPFMILVNLMIHTDTISLMAKMTGPMMKKFPGVSARGSFAVTAGFLCGYPMGAKVSADLIRKGDISRLEGAFLLSFCNNTSPMFIAGVLFTEFIPERQLHLPFLLIFFLSPLLCGQLFRLYYTHLGTESFPQNQLCAEDPFLQESPSLSSVMDHSLMDGFYAIVKVGLYMMLFSVLIRLLSLFLPGSGLCRALLLSSLEITGGLSLLSNLALPKACRYVLLMGSASFGGFCAVFQTASLIRDSGLKILPYIIQKLITALATSLFVYLYLSV